MPVKHDTKKNTFCTSSEEFYLKDGQFDNNWLGQSVMKSVDSELFQRRKDIKEQGEDKMTTLIWIF